MGYLRRKRSSSAPPKLEILYDDRERKPFKFDKCKYALEVRRKRLDVGDYTFTGYEGQIAIEKKHGLDELAVNISAADRNRFKAALDKLSKVPIRYLVIEDDLSRLDRVIRELPKQAKIDAHSILHWITKITVEYKIPVLLVGFRQRTRENAVLALFEHIIECDLPKLKRRPV
jgi:ERCC4-type nuclease